MIKGLLYSLTLLLSLFILVSLLEYFGYFGSVVRAILFWSYLVAAIVVLGYYVVVPLAKMFRLGKVMSYEDAAKIVGDHFPEIKDKLLNLLQLQALEKAGEDSLLASAIAQKTAQLSPIPFHNAVNLKSNRKYVKFALVPTLVILILLVVSPTLLLSSSHRITHYNTYFERPAPFFFKIENPQLQAVQYEDYELKVSVQGSSVPSEAFIVIDGNRFKMRQVNKSQYSYIFKSLQRTCSFYLQGADVRSTDYELLVKPKPSIVDFQAVVAYPSYIQKPSETFANEGDLVVPEGSVVKWILNTQNIDTLYFELDNTVSSIIPAANNRSTISHRAMRSFSYSFFGVSGFKAYSDSLKYSVSTISDGHPVISVVETRDSMIDDRFFFQGRIKDDYGFTKLVFKTIKTNEQDTSIKSITTTEIGILKEPVQDFYYTADLSELNLQPGEKLVYYFEIWDNDAIHGPKSATSQRFEVSIPTEKELENMIDYNSTEAQHNMQKSISELRQMQEDINNLMRKLVDKKELDWQDKKDFQELVKKQESIKQMMQQMQKQLRENKQLEQRYKDQSEHLLEKQRELDRLLNEVLNDEMKEMMNEMEKLMNEVDKKKVQEQLEKIKTDNESLEKQLDQNIELMKRLELEKDVEDAIRKTEELAQKQRELSEQNSQSKKKEDKEKAVEAQQKLSRQFDQLKQDIKDIQSRYNNLEEKLDFKVDDKQLNNIKQNQQGAEDNLNKGKNKDASKQQKDAADQLDELSEQLASAAQDIEQQDLAEDSEAIRKLLKNLVRLSFNQESLIQQVNSVYIQDPKYQGIITSQNRIKDDFRSVEDSLRAIAKRQVAVAKVLNKGISEINHNLSRSLSGLLDMNQTFYGSYKNVQSSQSMQYAMTSFNNLALVMAESLDQMQNQMRQNQQKKNDGSCKNPGMKMKGNCSNPGKGKPSAKSIKQLQQELNKQMEALKKQLDKQGKDKSNGRKKIGDRSSMQMSEEFARMAAQQEMIRRMMQQYGQELKQGAAGDAKLSREIDRLLKQMEQTETDLVNRVISQQTINRQQQILTRLLEHEKAEMQREKEERRESKEGKDMPHNPSQDEIDKYKRFQKENSDLFRTVPPSLSPYYRNKVQDYFYSL